MAFTIRFWSPYLIKLEFSIPSSRLPTIGVENLVPPSIRFFLLTIAPVKLFTPIPPEQPQGKTKNICVINKGGTLEKSDYSVYIGWGKGKIK